MRKTNVLKVVCALACAGAVGFAVRAETWTFTEAADRGDSNHWTNRERWTSQEGGTNGVPRAGDTLEILTAPNYMHRANLLGVYMKRIHFGPNAARDVAHNGFFLQGTDEAPGELLYEPATAAPWYCSIYVKGTAELNITHDITEQLDSGITGTAAYDRLIKTGAGRVRAKSGALAKMDSVVLRRGAVRVVGATALPQALDLYFDGTEGSAWFELESASQNMAGGHLHSATNTLPTANHGVTDLGSGYTLTLSGASPVDEQYFEGVLGGKLSFTWNPADATKAFRFARGQSPSAGTLTAESGIVRIGGGASFTALSKLVVGATGRLEIASDAGAVKAGLLEVTTGGQVQVPAGCAFTNGLVRLDGVRLADGTYTADNCSWVAGGGAVVADIYAGTYGAHQLVLDIPADATVGFAQAITNYNAANGTAYTLEDVNGGDLKDWTLVKRGAGTLTLDVTNSLYQGIVHLEAGLVNLVAQYGLGKSSNDTCPIYVHAGATLSTHYAEAVNVSRVGDRITHIIGTGTADNGALRATGAHLGYGTAALFGKEIVLDGDALVVHRDWYTPAKTLRLKGYTCTFRGSTDGWNAMMLAEVADDGHIKLFSSQLRYPGMTFAGTDLGNTITFGDKAGYRFWSNGINGAGANTWTGIFSGREPALFGDCGVSRDGGSNSFRNRFFVSNTVYIASQGNTSYGSIYLRGQVSGTGAFALYTGNSEAHYLHLMNTANDFTGGATVGRGVLCAYGGTSLPAAGTVKLNDTLDITKTADMAARPEFYGVALFGADACALPALVYDGTKSKMRVQGGRGRWQSVTKKGTGTLAYNSEAGAPLLDVRGGTFKLPRGAAPGLWEGITACADAAAAETARAGAATPTNWVMRGPTSAIQNPYQAPSTPSATKLITYAGYVWNRTGSDQTVTFASSVQGKATVKIDGVAVIDAAANARTAANVTLAPGAHAFEYRAVNGTPTAASADWPKWMGLAYDPQGRNDLAATNNFQAAVDPGDGSLFTRSTDEADLPAFDRMAFAAGTRLDVNGNAYAAARVSGWPVVTNSATDAAAAPALTLTAAYEADGATLAADRVLVAHVPVTFGADAVVSFTNIVAAKHGTYTLLRAAGDNTLAFAGAPSLRRRLAAASAAADEQKAVKQWMLALSDDRKTLTLAYVAGTLLLVR